MSIELEAEVTKLTKERDELRATLDETLAGWNEGIDTLNQVVDHNKELAMKLAKAREWIDVKGRSLAGAVDMEVNQHNEYMLDEFLAELDADTKGDA